MRSSLPSLNICIAHKYTGREMGTCYTNLYTYTAICRVYFQTKSMLMRYSKQLKKNPVNNRKQLKQKTKQKQSFIANPLNTLNDRSHYNNNNDNNNIDFISRGHSFDKTSIFHEGLKQ